MTFVKESNMMCTCKTGLTSNSTSEILKAGCDYRVEYIEIPGTPGGQVHVYSPVTGKQVRSFKAINDAHLRSIFRIDEVIFSGWTEAKDESRDEEKKDSREWDGKGTGHGKREPVTIEMREAHLSKEELDEIYGLVSDTLNRFDIRHFVLVTETKEALSLSAKVAKGSRVSSLCDLIKTTAKLQVI